ncbi:MAG: DUF2071 domain-containing protein [Rhizobacter sp.]|nr:DUF2071 domain-containing protein [Bacteriovorax sp.]
MSRLLLSLILFSAGVLHILKPGVFDPAIPFEQKWMINLLAGVFEIFLALGLHSKKIQDLSARLSALWFLCLIPIHIFVAWNHIAIFGVSNSFLLWGRTFFQPVFYFWALSLQTKGWIMAQEWRDVLFLHYEVDPEILQEQLPFPLDLYEGKAIISIVSFTMGGIRFPFLPTVPGLSKLNELNLRTYVEVNGIKGVYFFTLDADLLPAVGIGRIFFSLPYRMARIKIKKDNDEYFYESFNSTRSLKFSAVVGSVRDSDKFDLWSTERYGLFTKKLNSTLHGIVQHDSWPLQDVSLESIEDNFSTQLGQHLAARSFLRPAYCRKLKVRFRPFYKMTSTGKVSR